MTVRMTNTYALEILKTKEFAQISVQEVLAKGRKHGVHEVKPLDPAPLQMRILLDPPSKHRR
jgi:hypothetical protein